MKSTLRTVFFDLGNTLIYDRDPWAPFYARADQALLDVLLAAGLQADGQMYHGARGLLELYYYRRGKDTNEETTRVLLQQLLVERGNQIVSESVLRAALNAMYRVTQENWHAEEDALPTLRALKGKGFRLAVISNSSDDQNTQVLVDRSGFRPYLDWVVSSAAFGKRKPHPAIFHAALQHFGISAGEAAMVGDTFEADIVGASQTGMTSIWITRRVRKTLPRANLQPDLVVSTLSEILPHFSA